MFETNKYEIATNYSSNSPNENLSDDDEVEPIQIKKTKKPKKIKEESEDEEPEVEANINPKDVDISSTKYAEFQKTFESVGLEVKFVSNSKDFRSKLVRAQADAENFLMDIRKKKGKKNIEYIIMFPGQDTKIEVLSVDLKLKQLILVIQEPKRSMKVMVREKINAYTFINKEVIQISDPIERRFLIGKDDKHLFIAQLSQMAKTVKNAHQSLKPKKVKNMDTKDYIRQGEWFFVPINYDPMRAKGESINFKHTKKHGLVFGRGRPHVVDEYLEFNNKKYAKGNVVHPDHKTKYLKDWYEVLVNTEKRDENIHPSITWFD
jgi:hypothetical protein